MLARTPYLYFFFNATATTEIYTLSLHDALPIFRHHCLSAHACLAGNQVGSLDFGNQSLQAANKERFAERTARSEEHTSELQSQSNLVCRLLLEKKKKTQSLYTLRST